MGVEGTVSAPLRTALDPELLARIAARLGRVDGEPVALASGITNRNYRLRAGGRDVVVRVCAASTGSLGIDRDTEAVATQRAAAIAVGPEVLLRLREDDVLVCSFIAGAEMTAAGVRGHLGEIARALRAFHATPALPTAFAVYELVERQRAIAGPLPADYDALLEHARRIRATLAGHPDHVPVPCHNDLLASNFIAGDCGLRIVDWEYAGNNDRCFDLGNLAVNNELEEDAREELLEAYWEGEVTAHRRAALELMRFVSDLREAMWGASQQTLSDLHVDYAAYAEEHFARLRATARDPRMENWLRDAATP
jgi:thiamine kinase-like enzyme